MLTLLRRYRFANALSPSSQGEAFGYKNLGRVAKLNTRMLRPYIIISQSSTNLVVISKRTQLRSIQLNLSMHIRATGLV
jgi:hypothetical protein